MPGMLFIADDEDTSPIVTTDSHLLQNQQAYATAVNTGFSHVPNVTTQDEDDNNATLTDHDPSDSDNIEPLAWDNDYIRTTAHYNAEEDIREETDIEVVPPSITPPHDIINIDDDGDNIPPRWYPLCEWKQTTQYNPMTGTTYDDVINFTSSSDNFPQYTEAEREEFIFGIIMVQQYFLNKGLKKFGKKGHVAAHTELKQIHDFNTLLPVNPDTLTPEERTKALRSMFFLSGKCDSWIKGHNCLDGRPEWEHIKPEEASSPTANTDSVFITSAIDASEKRDIAFIDFPNAYLNAKNDRKVVMRVKGLVAKMLVAVEPMLYRKYIVYNNKGCPELYVIVQKALYGMMRSALLFYRHLVKHLKQMGFKLNPYDPCVANRMVNGSQQMVVWHVNDMKISHVDEFQNTLLIAKLSKIFGKIITKKNFKIYFTSSHFRSFFRIRQGRSDLFSILISSLKSFSPQIIQIFISFLVLFFPYFLWIFPIFIIT